MENLLTQCSSRWIILKQHTLTRREEREASDKICDKCF